MMSPLPVHVGMWVCLEPRRARGYRSADPPGDVGCEDADVTVSPGEPRAPEPWGEGLDEAEMAADPFRQFETWFAAAASSGMPQPNAMVLATASAGARPSARTVLLKHYGEQGFIFYTNYASRKGVELAENPRASLLFPWYVLHRQVVVAGDTRSLTRAESAAYFRSRPRGSQLGAWASERQSEVISSRAYLERTFDEAAARWPEGTEVPLPDFWGGTVVVPDEVEFWQGREDRLHDRLRYRLAEDGVWLLERLSP